MGLAGARATDQDHVLRPIHELTAMQCPDSGLIDLAGGEVEAREILVGWEARGLHVISDGAHLAFGQFGLQQLREHRDGGFNGWRALFDQVGDGLGHAIHLSDCAA